MIVVAILSGCAGSNQSSDGLGAQTEAEANEANQAVGSTDLESRAEVQELQPNGDYAIVASLRALDRTNILEPTLTFDLPLKAEPLAPLPSECILEPESRSITCLMPDYLPDENRAPTEWIGLTVTVKVDSGTAGTKTVAVTATSLDNPVTNDPDPTNNTVEVTLG